MRPVSAFEDTTGALQVSGCGNVGLVFKGSEIVDFGGLGGPGGPGNLAKKANLPNWPQNGPAVAEGWCFSNLIFRPAVYLC